MGIHDRLARAPSRWAIICHSISTAARASIAKLDRPPLTTESSARTVSATTWRLRDPVHHASDRTRIVTGIDQPKRHGLLAYSAEVRETVSSIATPARAPIAGSGRRVRAHSTTPSALTNPSRYSPTASPCSKLTACSRDPAVSARTRPFASARAASVTIVTAPSNRGSRPIQTGARAAETISDTSRRDTPGRSAKTSRTASAATSRSTSNRRAASRCSDDANTTEATSAIYPGQAVRSAASTHL